jgi:predicted GNAT family N-acyltransferase
MMTLMRELLKCKGKTLGFYPAKPIAEMRPEGRGPVTPNDSQIASLRLLTFLQNPAFVSAGVDPGASELHPLAPAVDKNTLAAQVAALPPQQCLVSAGSIDVYYSSMAQTPDIVTEIQRLRESVFRALEEGSGQPLDGDDFDESYIHLFLFERSTERIVGGCRLGRTDILLRSGGVNSLYLNRMFSFGSGFINMTHSCLEMGRSFIAPDFQRSYQAFQLLFKGIGSFISLFPQYQTLYGTVSISRQYSPLSTLLIRETLVKSTRQVSARRELSIKVPPEMTDYVENTPTNLSNLDWLVRQLETDGKGLPVLLRHYAKMDARFYALGIDPNFAGTPGLLLSVDLACLPSKVRQRYLSDKPGNIQYKTKN